VSGILSIRIYEGSDLHEKELIVLPKGAIYTPSTTGAQEKRVVTEINILIDTLPATAEAVEALIEQVTTSIHRNVRLTKEPTNG
jgi:hypothetical protein